MVRLALRVCDGYNKAIKNRAFSAGLATSCSPFMAALCIYKTEGVISGPNSH